MQLKTPSVEQFLASLDHPQIDLINQLRETIKNAAPVLAEGVKWNAPSYALNGNDIITFNFRNYGRVSLIFHTGPKGKDTKSGNRLFEDSSGLVEWLADKRFVLKVADIDQLNRYSNAITGLVHTWVEYAMRNFEPLA